MRILCSVALVAALASTAAAQRAPDMATLDRGDGISKIALDVGLSFLDTGALDPVQYSAALRFEAYGQYVTRSGLGIYGSLPLTASMGAPSDDDDPMDMFYDNAVTLGNLELGGLYVVTKSPTVSFVFHGGLSVPTAGDSIHDFATLQAGIMPRMTDMANTSGNWFVRLGFSPLLYIDKLFLRFDIGFDLATTEADPHFLRFNLGGGVDLGTVALSLESTNSVQFFDDGEEFIDVLALTMRFMGERLQPYLAVGAPLDDTRDRVQLFIAGGLQFVP